jgi:hypothetical protein
MTNLPNNLSVIEASDKSFWDYHLVDEIDGSETIIGCLVIRGEKDWELDADGVSYRGPNLREVVSQYLTAQGQSTRRF